MSVRIFSRIGAYVKRPDVGRDPLRLLMRRAIFEVDQYVFPGRLHHERIVRMDGDLKIAVRPIDEIERSIWLYGYHDFASAMVFAALVKPGMTVVDVGAHVGQFTLLAAKRVANGGRVIAIEPQPVTRERLEANVGRNNLSNVTVVSAALSDVAGRVMLRVPRWAGANSGMASINYSGPSQGEFEVEQRTLDDVIGDGPLDVVKVDVEGAEAKVFIGGRNAITRNRPAIIFEADDLLYGRYEVDPAVEALRDYGYRLHGIVHDGGRYRLHEIGSGDDLVTYREAWRALNLVALHPERPFSI